MKIKNISVKSIDFEVGDDVIVYASRLDQFHKKINLIQYEKNLYNIDESLLKNLTYLYYKSFGKMFQNIIKNVYIVLYNDNFYLTNLSYRIEAKMVDIKSLEPFKVNIKVTEFRPHDNCDKFLSFNDTTVSVESDELVIKKFKELELLTSHEIDDLFDEYIKFKYKQIDNFEILTKIINNLNNK